MAANPKSSHPIDTGEDSPSSGHCVAKKEKPRTLPPYSPEEAKKNAQTKADHGGTIKSPHQAQNAQFWLVYAGHQEAETSCARYLW